jgi:hypothetical protein
MLEKAVDKGTEPGLEKELDDMGYISPQKPEEDSDLYLISGQNGGDPYWLLDREIPDHYH